MDASNEIKAEAPRLPYIFYLLLFIPILTWGFYNYIPLSWINIGQTNFVPESASIGKLIILLILFILSLNIWRAEFSRVLLGYSIMIKDNHIKIINTGLYVKEIDASKIDHIVYGDEYPFWKSFNFDYINYKIYMKDGSKPIFFNIYIHFANVEEINKILEARFGKLEYEKFDI